jgi:hypothetical protein
MGEEIFLTIVFEDGHYRFKGASNDRIGNLGFFLSSDVRCFRSSFKEWILDTRYDYTAGNISKLEKDGDYILISDQYSEEDDDNPPLKIHRAELIKILDAWEQFCKTRPKEIIITQEGEVFNIEGKF